MDKQLVVRLDADTYNAMQRYADDTERTMSQVVRFAVKRLFDSPSERIVVRPAIALADDLPEEVQAPKVEKPKRTGQGSVQAFLSQYKEEEAS